MEHEQASFCATRAILSISVHLSIRKCPYKFMFSDFSRKMDTTPNKTISVPQMRPEEL